MWRYNLDYIQSASFQILFIKSFLDYHIINAQELTASLNKPQSNHSKFTWGSYSSEYRDPCVLECDTVIFVDRTSVSDSSVVRIYAPLVINCCQQTWFSNKAVC